MAQAPDVDEYGNEVDPYELQQRASQSSGGYNAPASSFAAPTKATPTFSPQQRDSVVQGWLKSSYGANRQGIEQYLGSLGDSASGWRVDREDKVYDPSGRSYDWIHNVGTAGAKKRSGYTTDPRYSNVSGATAKGTGSPGGAPGVAAALGAPAPTAPASNPQMQQLMDQLIARAQQGLNVDRNNPVIRNQADAYAANEERARRNYLGDVAEQAGPLANLRGEERLAAERVGQRTGAFEAELMGRELTAKREEIAQALQQWQGMLTTQQQLALQRELAKMDDAIKRLQISTQNSQFGQDLSFRNRQLSEQGRQFNTGMGFNYDEFDWRRNPLNPNNFPQQK